MRKIVIGVIIGACLMFSSQAFGEEISLIGQKISKEVKVIMLGEELEKKAILLDGVTYVPLRVIIEQFGLEAAYENGEVIVREPNKEARDLMMSILTKENELIEINNMVEANNNLIKTLEKRIIDEAGKTDYMPGFSPDEQLKLRTVTALELQQKLSKFQSELAELENKKTALEAQQ